MKSYGLKLYTGTFLQNVNIEGGTVLPESGTTEGQLFFQSDLNKLYIRDSLNEEWIPVGAGSGNITDNGDGTYTIINSEGFVTIIDTRAETNPYDSTLSGLGSLNVQDAIDEVFAKTLTYEAAEGIYLKLTGGTVVGDTSFDGNLVKNIGDPVGEGDAVSLGFLNTTVGNQKIEEHSNITINPLSEGDIISWDASFNSWRTSSVPASNFTDLKDTPEFMTLGDSFKFVRVDPSGIKLEFHSPIISDMVDVNSSSAKNNQVLTYDSLNMQWIPKNAATSIEVNTGVITETNVGVSTVFDDLNVMDWSGHPKSDETVLTSIYIQPNDLWTFIHGGIAYFWNGPSDVTVGLGGSYVSISSDFVKTGSANNWIAANNSIDFPNSPTATAGSIAIGDGAHADGSDNRILLKTSDAGLRIKSSGEVETTANGGVNWMSVATTSVLQKTHQYFTNVAEVSDFSFVHNAGFLDVFYNGVKLIEGLGYTPVSNTGFTLMDAVIDSQDIIYAVSYDIV